MSNGENNFKGAVVKKLVDFFYKGYLNYSLESSEIQALTWDRQQSLLDATVNTKAVKKYPVNSEFSRLFFKKLIGYLEPVLEVHDEFYTYLCSVMKNADERENFCYRHYIINKNLENRIIIRETNNMVVNGTTGMRTWQAALMITDWALCHPKVFNNKKILELGSGVGFTGITIAKHCSTQSVTLSDCHSDVLRTIGENIRINFPDMKQEDEGYETIYRNEDKILGVMKLDWNCLEDLPHHLVPDVLIGADIIYDPTIIFPLCNLIKTFFDRNKDLEVYIANIIRNEDTCKQFINTIDKSQVKCSYDTKILEFYESLSKNERVVKQTLDCGTYFTDAMNFHLEQISQTKSVLIDWDNNIHRCLFKIKLKEI